MTRPVTSYRSLARLADTRARLEHALVKSTNPSGQAFLKRRLDEVMAEEERARAQTQDRGSEMWSGRDVER